MLAWVFDCGGNIAMRFRNAVVLGVVSIIIVALATGPCYVPKQKKQSDVCAQTVIALRAISEQNYRAIDVGWGVSRPEREERYQQVIAPEYMVVIREHWANNRVLQDRYIDYLNQHCGAQHD